MVYSATQLQLTHILQRLYRRLGGKVLLATGGSIITVADTKLADDLGESNEDDFYNGGTVIVIEDAGGANAAPEGEFSRITDYTSSSSTATFSPALTVAIASGDRVLVAPPDFPLYDVIEVVNDALKNLGDIPLVNTSLTSAALQTEYTLPLALKGRELLDVSYQGKTGDTDDNQYIPVNWSAIPATAGSTATLVLPQLTESRTIKIEYLGKHPRVDTYSDHIAECLHPELVHASVLAHVLQWRNDSGLASGGADENLLRLESKAWSQLDRARILYPIEIPPRRIPSHPSWETTTPSTRIIRSL